MLIEKFQVMSINNTIKTLKEANCGRGWNRSSREPIHRRNGRSSKSSGSDANHVPGGNNPQPTDRSRHTNNNRQHRHGLRRGANKHPLRRLLGLRTVNSTDRRRHRILQGCRHHRISSRTHLHGHQVGQVNRYQSLRLRVVDAIRHEHH